MSEVNESPARARAANRQPLAYQRAADKEQFASPLDATIRVYAPNVELRRVLKWFGPGVAPTRCPIDRYRSLHAERFMRAHAVEYFSPFVRFDLLSF